MPTNVRVTLGERLLIAVEHMEVGQLDACVPWCQPLPQRLEHEQQHVDILADAVGVNGLRALQTISQNRSWYDLLWHYYFTVLKRWCQF